MRAAFESSQGQDADGTIEGAGGRSFQTDFSLKEGETLTLKLANVSPVTLSVSACTAQTTAWASGARCSFFLLHSLRCCALRSCAVAA